MRQDTYELLKNITEKEGDDLKKCFEKDPDLLRYAAIHDTFYGLLDHIRAPIDLKQKVYNKINEYEKEPRS